jgi:hypothetical protein
MIVDIGGERPRWLFSLAGIVGWESIRVGGYESTTRSSGTSTRTSGS